jgi:hypothetical protein
MQWRALLLPRGICCRKGGSQLVDSEESLTIGTLRGPPPRKYPPESGCEVLFSTAPVGFRPASGLFLRDAPCMLTPHTMRRSQDVEWRVGDIVGLSGTGTAPPAALCLLSCGTESSRGRTEACGVTLKAAAPSGDDCEAGKQRFSGHGPELGDSTGGCGQRRTHSHSMHPDNGSRGDNDGDHGQHVH